MEASPGISQASRDQAFEAVKASVVTRAFGIRIGAFGVDYTSKKVTVDPDEKAGAKKRDTRGQAFLTELERERLRESIAASSWQEASSGRQAEAQPSHPDPAWRRGLAAYARARDQFLVDTARRGATTLAVA